MITTSTAILQALAAGNKSRAQLVQELDDAPALVAGELAKMVNRGQVVVSGKTRVKGKDVSVYAVAKQQSAATESNAKQASGQAGQFSRTQASDLYEVWGGYFPIHSQPSKNMTIRRHIEA